MKKITALLLFISILKFTSAQVDLENMVDENPSDTKEFVSATFKGFKVINAQSNETAKKHNLFFNITHRFGDAATSDAKHTLFGFDNAADIRFSFDYGLTDRLQIGIGRSKGIDPYAELYDGNIKFKLLQQTINNKMPLSVTLFAVAAVSGQTPNTDLSNDASFQNFSQRWSYVVEAIVARKFSPSISFELLPAYLHRNYVLYGDENDVFSLGAGARVKLTKRFAIIADYYHIFSPFRMNANASDGSQLYFDPLSVGIEIETGGHVFTINFTNSRGILENSYLTATKSNWLDGEFRFGFNISRNFVLGGKKW